MMALMSPPRSTPMKNLFSSRRPSVQLDPAAFVADPELIRALDARSTPVPVRVRARALPPGRTRRGVSISSTKEWSRSASCRRIGHSLFAAQAKPGSLLGLPGVISNQPYTLTATASAGRRSASSAAPISPRSCRRTRYFLSKCSKSSPPRSAAPAKRSISLDACLPSPSHPTSPECPARA